jgi:hypothetical protein
LAERLPSKQDVAGSNPVSRSHECTGYAVIWAIVSAATAIPVLVAATIGPLPILIVEDRARLTLDEPQHRRRHVPRLMWLNERAHPMTHLDETDGC